MHREVADKIDTSSLLYWIPIGGGTWQKLESCKYVSKNEDSESHNLGLSVAIVCELVSLVAAQVRWRKITLHRRNARLCLVDDLERCSVNLNEGEIVRRDKAAMLFGRMFGGKLQFDRAEAETSHRLAEELQGCKQRTPILAVIQATWVIIGGLVAPPPFRLTTVREAENYSRLVLLTTHLASVHLDFHIPYVDRLFPLLPINL